MQQPIPNTLPRVILTSVHRLHPKTLQPQINALLDLVHQVEQRLVIDYPLVYAGVRQELH